MAGTTGLEPATSAVTGQRSDQLSYVPKIVFNNLDICHIESSGSQLSLFSLVSTLSLLWTQFRAFLDTKWTPNWTPKSSPQRQNQVYQMRQNFGVQFPRSQSKKIRSLFDPWICQAPRNLSHLIQRLCAGIAAVSCRSIIEIGWSQMWHLIVPLSSTIPRRKGSTATVENVTGFVMCVPPN